MKEDKSSQEARIAALNKLDQEIKLKVNKKNSDETLIMRQDLEVTKLDQDDTDEFSIEFTSQNSQEWLFQLITNYFKGVRKNSCLMEVSLSRAPPTSNVFIIVNVKLFTAFKSAA